MSFTPFRHLGGGGKSSFKPTVFTYLSTRQLKLKLWVHLTVGNRKNIENIVKTNLILKTLLQTHKIIITTNKTKEYS